MCRSHRTRRVRRTAERHCCATIPAIHSITTPSASKAKDPEATTQRRNGFRRRPHRRQPRGHSSLDVWRSLLFCQAPRRRAAQRSVRLAMRRDHRRELFAPLAEIAELIVAGTRRRKHDPVVRPRLFPTPASASPIVATATQGNRPFSAAMRPCSISAAEPNRATPAARRAIARPTGRNRSPSPRPRPRAKPEGPTPPRRRRSIRASWPPNRCRSGGRPPPRTTPTAAASRKRWPAPSAEPARPKRPGGGRRAGRVEHVVPTRQQQRRQLLQRRQRQLPPAHQRPPRTCLRVERIQNGQVGGRLPAEDPLLGGHVLRYDSCQSRWLGRQPVTTATCGMGTSPPMPQLETARSSTTQSPRRSAGVARAGCRRCCRRATPGAAAARRMAAVMVAVVDFPLEPVTPITAQGTPAGIGRFRSRFPCRPVGPVRGSGFRAAPPD